MSLSIGILLLTLGTICLLMGLTGGGFNLEIGPIKVDIPKVSKNRQVIAWVLCVIFYASFVMTTFDMTSDKQIGGIPTTTPALQAEPAPPEPPTVASSTKAPKEPPTAIPRTVAQPTIEPPTPAPPTIASPTNEPPTPAPPTLPPEGTYSDGFNEQNSQLWCEFPPGGVSIAGGEYSIAATRDTLYELHPCPQYDRNLQYVELTLHVVDATGYAGGSHTGIGGALSGGRYFNFALDSDKTAFVMYGVSHGPNPEFAVKRPLDNLNDIHKLRVEWTGSEVHFFLDDALLDTVLPSDGAGGWFYLYTRAYTDCTMTAAFDRVEWGMFPN